MVLPWNRPALQLFDPWCLLFTYSNSYVRFTNLIPLRRKLIRNSDEDLHNAALRLPFDNTEKIGSVRVTYITLAVGIVSMFCFIGGQESVTLMTFRAQ